ncbi:MAG: diguanylate cyclase [Myxococcota bacterium]
MKPSVLIVDDSFDVHELLTVRLRTEDLTLHHADDGPSGLRIAADVRPDLILLDVDMPDMGGFDVIRKLKEDPRTQGIPVVFLTANGAVEQKVTGFDLGAVDYVTKPFEPSELRARVRAALRTKRYQDLLSTRASVDALTTLWNRAHFERRLAEELAASIRYGRKLSLVMVDVDHFKRLNDTYGHPTGDRVLQRIGELLWNSVRTTDVPCRYGGEEFALLLPETELDPAILLAERIRVAVSELRFDLRGQVIQATASLGVAAVDRLPEPGRDALIQAADDALYAAKHGGRNCVKAHRGTEDGTP